MKKLAYAVLTTAMAGGLALSSAGVASAGHCVEGDSPGFSYFGTGHASQDREAQGSKEGPHFNPNTEESSSGASACKADTGNPSDRSSGK